VETAWFLERADRTAYLRERFGPYLVSPLLDVGCDRAVLRTLMPDLEYTGVDIGGAPDVRLDLENTERLPFPDGAFGSVICLDVLEHLDNLHVMFEELVRVAARYVVISLPNCWGGARQPIGRGRGSFAYYGLPVDRPADRHKWFFNYTEAREFMAEHARRRGLRIREWVVNEKPRAAVSRFFRRLRYSRKDAYLNRYAHTLWTVFELHGTAR
jgi:hypothetical protein